MNKAEKATVAAAFAERKSPASDRKLGPMPAVDVVNGAYNVVAIDRNKNKPADKAEPADLEVEALEFIDEDDVTERTIELVRPFKWNDQVHKSVTFRHMTGADLIKIQQGKMEEAGDKMFEIVTGFPGRVIRGMHADDMVAVMSGAIPFLPQEFRKNIETLGAEIEKQMESEVFPDSQSKTG